MVNCPKCGTPNPDTATRCLACSAPLEGQKFAQALDRAQAKTSGSWPQIQIPQGSIPPAPSAPVSGQPDQAEVNQYIVSARSRKRRTRLLWISVAVSAVAAAGFYFYRSAEVERSRRAAAAFMTSFMGVDGGPIATFWRCMVGAKRQDIHRAKDNLVVTSGIERAFQAQPRKHPERIKRACIPAIDDSKQALRQLKPPEGFVEPLAKLVSVLDGIKGAVDQLAGKMDQAKDLASHESEIVAAAQSFHDPGRTEPDKAAGYVKLLRCALPGLAKMARRVRMPPDTQSVIETIFASCKADPKYADKLRRDCYPELTRGNKRSQLYRLVSRRMAGDDRDVAAIKHCFKKAHQGFFHDELAAVGKGWVDYRNAVNRVANRVSAYKEGASESTATQ